MGGATRIEDTTNLQEIGMEEVSGVLPRKQLGYTKKIP